MRAKHLFAFGEDNPKRRLVMWATACVLSSVFAYVWWPFGAVPFVLLFAKSVMAARKL